MIENKYFTFLHIKKKKSNQLRYQRLRRNTENKSWTMIIVFMKFISAHGSSQEQSAYNQSVSEAPKN